MLTSECYHLKTNNMSKIPTAEEWLISFGADADDMFYKHSVEEAMIEFAKLHVEAALKAASNKAEATLESSGDEEYPIVIKNSILNSYSLNNIK